MLSAGNGELMAFSSVDLKKWSKKTVLASVFVSAGISLLICSVETETVNKRQTLCDSTYRKYPE